MRALPQTTFDIHWFGPFFTISFLFVPGKEKVLENLMAHMRWMWKFQRWTGLCYGRFNTLHYLKRCYVKNANSAIKKMLRTKKTGNGTRPCRRNGLNNWEKWAFDAEKILVFFLKKNEKAKSLWSRGLDVWKKHLGKTRVFFLRCKWRIAKSLSHCRKWSKETILKEKFQRFKSPPFFQI